jgi:hypothetical protein
VHLCIDCRIYNTSIYYNITLYYISVDNAVLRVKYLCYAKCKSALVLLRAKRSLGDILRRLFLFLVAVNSYVPSIQTDLYLGSRHFFPDVRQRF